LHFSLILRILFEFNLIIISSLILYKWTCAHELFQVLSLLIFFIILRIPESMLNLVQWFMPNVLLIYLINHFIIRIVFQLFDEIIFYEFRFVEFQCTYLIWISLLFMVFVQLIISLHVFQGLIFFSFFKVLIYNWFWFSKLVY
jgi:hypothetical protein